MCFWSVLIFDAFEGDIGVLLRVPESWQSSKEGDKCHEGDEEHNECNCCKGDHDCCEACTSIMIKV